MKLTEQVVSLELAKRLKELGVKQESYFIWWYTEPMSTDMKYFPHVGWDKRSWALQVAGRYLTSDEFNGRAAAAFTVGELGEMLPTQCYSYRVRDYPEWRCHANEADGGNTEVGNIEADARAKMLIYLIENKLITPREITKGE